MTVERPSRRVRKPARVVIADDHELARAGIRSMLAGERGLELVGEATDGGEAVSICRQLHPELALLDVRMPGMDGVAATRAIKESSPETIVVLVTMYASPDYLLEALKAGAAGYLLKDASRREVITALRQVLQGESLLTTETTSRLMRRMAGETPRPAQQPIERLTQRERDVLTLMVNGHTNREISQDLNLSLGAVKAHVEHIITKLGASDRTQAAVRAVEQGFESAVVE
jgi:DNA-binding NarL/FixJ family response regulator